LLRRQTLTSQVVDYVLDLIKSGRVKAGEKLPTEEQLTHTLGVSRTCVREAMKSLESLRVVSIRPRIGATVLEPSSLNLVHAEHFSIALQQQETDVLLEFRKIMEVGLASLAAEKADAADLKAMSAALDNYREEVKQNRIDCCTDMSFHAALAKASKNPMAELVWQMISSHLAPMLEKTQALPNVAEETLHDHQKIFQAVKSANPRKAREAMRMHLENADRVWRIANSEGARNHTPVRSSR
jgi:GntR family transcriptional regulator, transcriptional repressor for pyruvate dehydrogenase complex